MARFPDCNCPRPQLVQGSVEAVLLYEQVDSTQIAGRLLMGKANGRPVPHPFKLAVSGGCSSAQRAPSRCAVGHTARPRL